MDQFSIGIKVSHRLACEIASGFCKELKAIGLKDANETSLPNSVLLKKMHKASRTRHENQNTKLYADLALAAPVPLSYASVSGLGKHPWLRPSGYLRVFAKEGKIDLLMGGSSTFDVVEEFWSRYSHIEPQHPVFKFSKEELKHTLHGMLYADEGQTLKKQALMVFAVQPVLGRGTLASQSSRKDANAMGLNFQGSCYKTRVLVGVLGKKSCYHKKKQHVLDSFAAYIVDDCNAMFDTGVAVNLDGRRVQIRLCVIAVKGDWPILLRLGHLTRSFNRLTKRGRGKNGNRNECKGICHLCLAGYPGISYGEYGEDAKWVSTYLKEPPFQESDPSPFWRLRQSPQLELLCHYDPFHVMHKGIFAELAGSAVVAW